VSIKEILYGQWYDDSMRRAELVAPIHERMPLILEPEDFEAWLSPGEPSAELRAAPKADELSTVATAVRRSRSAARRASWRARPASCLDHCRAVLAWAAVEYNF
jgi:hypothetical protein